MVGIRQFNEEALLSQVIQTFWRKGYTATSMLDLAKETGVQRGSLYNAYKNKDALFTKAFKHYTQNFLHVIKKELKNECAYVAFEQLFHTLCERLLSDKDKKGCFSTRTIMEASQQCEGIQNDLKVFLDQIESIIAERLLLAKKDKQFLGDPEMMAQFLVALTRGAAVIERVYDKPEKIRRIYHTGLEQLALIPKATM